MAGDGDWWHNPWMVLLFAIAAVPLVAGLVVVTLLCRSARSVGWSGTRAVALVLALGSTIWWAADW